MVALSVRQHKHCARFEVWYKVFILSPYTADDFDTTEPPRAVFTIVKSHYLFKSINPLAKLWYKLRVLQQCQFRIRHFKHIKPMFGINRYRLLISGSFLSRRTMQSLYFEAIIVNSLLLLFRRPLKIEELKHTPSFHWQNARCRNIPPLTVNK